MFAMYLALWVGERRSSGSTHSRHALENEKEKEKNNGALTPLNPNTALGALLLLPLLTSANTS